MVVVVIPPDPLKWEGKELLHEFHDCWRNGRPVTISYLLVNLGPSGTIIELFAAVSWTVNRDTQEERRSVSNELKEF